MLNPFVSQNAPLNRATRPVGPISEGATFALDAPARPNLTTLFNLSQARPVLGCLMRVGGVGEAQRTWSRAGAFGREEARRARLASATALSAKGLHRRRELATQTRRGQISSF